MSGGLEWTKQTVEFESFSLRTFKVMDNGPCFWKVNSFMTSKPLNGVVQRFRSQAFSPACLFRFSESSVPLRDFATVPWRLPAVGRGEGRVRGNRKINHEAR